MCGSNRKQIGMLVIQRSTGIRLCPGKTKVMRVESADPVVGPHITAPSKHTAQKVVSNA